MNWIQEAELALKAVSSSTELIEEAYPGGMAIATKGNPRDIVTAADVTIEEHITAILAASKHPVLGEEKSGSGTFKGAGGIFWAVDPIDGTTNFVSSIPLYAISVGLVDGKVFRIGAVSLPASKELYFTHGNDAAFRNGKRLAVRDAKLESSLLAAAFSSSRTDKEKRNIEFSVFGELNDSSRGCLRLGSAAVNICYVASGRLQCAYGVGNKIWDVAGALAVAGLAGAKVYLDMAAGSEEISYVVGAPGAADAVKEKLTAHGLGTFEIMK